jgi:hypothetical protein
MTLFSSDPLELAKVNQYQAMELIRNLLWDESSNVGVPKHLIDAAFNINVKDGGIDALIRDAKPSNDEIIPDGYSGFQVKSSDLPPKECKKELHERGDLDGDLKELVEYVLENAGTYVLILFADLTALQKKNRRDAIVDELSRHYSTPKVRIYTIDNLISFARRFPGLSKLDEGVPFRYGRITLKLGTQQFSEAIPTETVSSLT